MNKVGVVLIGFGVFVAALVFLAIESSFKHMADTLEYGNPSRSIGHSIDKKVFIDTLDILLADTAELNDIGRQKKTYVVPTISWIEKSTYWKSDEVNLDPLGFEEDTVNLVLLFESYVDGERWRPVNSGQYYGRFKSTNGDSSSLYIDDNGSRLDFKIPTRQLLDTIRLETKNKEEIIIRRRK